MKERSLRTTRGARVALVGLGNIGSQTTALLPGVEDVSGVLLADGDRYEKSNLGCQRIAPGDVGRYKVDVQAKFLRRVAPHIAIETFAQPVESLPLGLLRVHVIVACVDSRIARQSINRIAFALGVPWIDAAIDRNGQVRSRVYAPGAGPCLECAWGPGDYALLEQRVPCAGTVVAGPTPATRSTAAPQELGAVAAGLQVSHLRRVLSGADNAASAAGRQWFFDIASGRGWVGSYAANPACRVDHARWEIIELARSASNITLAEALRLPGGDAKENSLALEGQAFVRRLRCAYCGHTRKTGGRLSGRIRVRACRECGGVMTASAADVIDSLTARRVRPQWMDAPLSAFGLVNADVFSVRTNNATRHYQLCGAHEELS